MRYDGVLIQHIFNVAKISQICALGLSIDKKKQIKLKLNNGSICMIHSDYNKKESWNVTLEYNKIKPD